MRIDERVFEAIACGEVKNYSAGLNFICPAIDLSARKLRQKDRVSAKEYKKFLREYVWIFQYFTNPGFNLKDFKFPANHLSKTSRFEAESADFADLLYHAYRCSLAHGDPIDGAFEFSESQDQSADRITKIKLDGSIIQFPPTFYWSAIALVVFCRSNNDVETNSQYYLSWDAHRFPVDFCWGAEDRLRRFFKTRPVLTVEIDTANEYPRTIIAS
ncbi:MAG: hypothetical protein AAFP80_14000 [Pseudomonadota bacterium]